MRAYSIDLRRKIVELHKEGKISQRKLAQQFHVALSFIEKLLKQEKETGNIEPKKRTKQTPTKLTPEQIKVLDQLVEEYNDATLDELSQLLEDRIGVLISRVTVDRMLRKLNLTFKKKALHPTEKESERVQEQRYEFWQSVREILAKDMIFIDESGINLALTRLFARSPKGKRARGARPLKRGKNVSVIGAIGLNGLLTQTSILGSADGLTFEAFIATRLVPKLWAGAYVFMDNCSIHKGENIASLIAAAGATLIYLPPYSPDFSPIENCWSKIKNFLRSMAARNYPDLLKALEDAFKLLSPSDFQGWFTHCCFCTSLD
jgi:transposase